MPEYPLTVPMLLRRAERVFGRKAIVSRDSGPERVRLDWAAVYERVLRLMEALRSLGVGPGDRVATLAWNHHRHVELYFAVPCLGAVLHTLNARLSLQQLGSIVAHAGDSVVFADRGLGGPLERRGAGWETVREVVWMGAETGEGTTAGFDYEDLLLGAAPREAFPDLDERAAAGLCYTSGTTGEPKGVVYSHRALVLHAMGICMRDSFGLASDDVILPIVPMFHANAWGLVHGAALCGASLVLPGPHLRGGALLRLIREEGVTFAAGVPTVWKLVVEAWVRAPGPAPLRTAIVGGAPVSESLLRELDEAGIPAVQSWGMTELTPVGTVNRLDRREAEGWNEAERLRRRTRQGRPVPGVEARICDGEGDPLPWDGEATGELEARGPWVATQYFRGDPADPVFRAGGWFRTGDAASIDAGGSVFLSDRKKDLIKVGGEWLSSAQLENAVMNCPGVAEAAAVARPDPVRGEAPVVYVVLQGEARLSGETLRRKLLAAGWAGWQVPKPGDFRFVETIPRTSVGKFDKAALRAWLTEES
ncbi:MAG TPA: long-chain-fatty-acid--CoA ligase [Verrucomicrobiales bacterium]|nr:long-chain-fatty-acid--CoA ligase [Verrucomicrobiales bacterium]